MGNSAFTIGIPFQTVEVTGTSQTMLVNTSYIANNAAMVTLTMPAAMKQNDFIEVLGKGAGLFTIAVTTGQIINFGSVPTTVSTGAVAATNRYNCVTIRCITDDTTFVVTASQGNFNVT